MATLEVHNDRGGVEYVAIASGSTALIGRDPKCDIVLDDPKVLPIHARLRWKRGHLKIEATPDAHAVNLNGRRVIASKLRQGDELRVGSHRIFVMSEDEAAPDTEKTRIQERPPSAGRIERGDWLKDLEVAPPEPSSEEQEDRQSLAWVRMAAKTSAMAADPDPAPAREPGWVRRRLAPYVNTERAPDDERVATSPAVISLVISLLVLALMSVGLWRVIARRTADNRYLLAMEVYGDGDYLNAVRQFDRFVEHHPSDVRAGRARMLGALSRVRQFASGSAPAWSEALASATRMNQQFRNQQAFEDLRADLAQTVLSIADGLADRARSGPDSHALAEAESAVKLHDALAGKPAAAIRARSRLPGRLQEARRVVRRGQARQAALERIDRALDERSANGCYEARDALIVEYPDLANDPAVIDRLRKANTLLQQAVTIDPSTLPAATVARPDPLGPATLLALRSSLAPAAEGASSVFALVDDQACALSADQGAPLWAITVGHGAPFPPRPIAGTASGLLVIDARHNDLLRLDAHTGAIVWRQPLNEPANAPPLVLGNDLFQPTTAGKIIRIDVETGERRGGVDLRQPITQAPLTDELGRTLYVLGLRSNLFLIDRESLRCVGVEYIGHDVRSIGATPLRIVRYLVLPVNHGLTDGHWSIWLLSEDGRSLSPIQRIDLAGWTWHVPTPTGSVLWAASDRGDLAAFAIGAESEREPFRLIAKMTAQTDSLGPTFPIIQSDRDIIVSSRQPTSYHLDAERGHIGAAWSVVGSGRSIAPVQLTGRLAVFTQQAARGPGVTLWGIDLETGRQAWHTTVGAHWPALVRTDLSGGGSLAAIGLDGSELALAPELVHRGGFIESIVPPPTAIRMPEISSQYIRIADMLLVTPSIGDDRLIFTDSSATMHEVPLPSAATAAPISWGTQLVLPSRGGLIELIDPRTGVPVADPYIPPFDREHPYDWRTPAVIDETRIAVVDASGRVRVLARQEKPHPRLEAEGAMIELGSPPVADPVASPQAIVIATADRQVRALAVRDRSPLGAWSLPAPLATGPSLISDYIITSDRSGHVLALDRDGRRDWEAELGREPIGAPAQFGTILWFIDVEGTLIGISTKDGSIANRIALGIVPQSGPIALDEGLVIPTGPGIVRHLPGSVLDHPTTGEARP